MSDELARLRADLEVLERYSMVHGGMASCKASIQAKIARLEAEADPWREAWEFVEHYRSMPNRPGQVAAFVDHLAAENARLAVRVEELEANRLSQESHDRLIEWFGALEDTRREFLDADDYKLVKAIYESCGRTVPGSVIKGCADPFDDEKAVMDAAVDLMAGLGDDNPVLDPARVLKTAASILKKRGDNKIAAQINE